MADDRTSLSHPRSRSADAAGAVPGPPAEQAGPAAAVTRADLGWRAALVPGAHSGTPASDHSRQVPGFRGERRTAVLRREEQEARTFLVVVTARQAARV